MKVIHGSVLYVYILFCDVLSRISQIRSIPVPSFLISVNQMTCVLFVVCVLVDVVQVGPG